MTTADKRRGQEGLRDSILTGAGVEQSFPLLLSETSSKVLESSLRRD
jgi:hypothetical protein